MAMKRLSIEYNDLLRKPIPLCTVTPQDNFLKWKAKIKGPTDSPYDGGVFTVNIKYPENYPSAAPNVTFETKIFHPNIDDSGDICVSLWSKWLPTNTITTVLLAIIGLLGNPNFESSNWGQNTTYYENNRHAYVKKAKKWTKKYAE